MEKLHDKFKNWIEKNELFLKGLKDLILIIKYLLGG